MEFVLHMCAQNGLTETSLHNPVGKISIHQLDQQVALEEWGNLLGDGPTAGAILDRFLLHAQTIAITGRSYRFKDHAAIAGKEDKNKKTKSKSNEPSTAEQAS